MQCRGQEFQYQCNYKHPVYIRCGQWKGTKLPGSTGIPGVASIPNAKRGEPYKTLFVALTQPDECETSTHLIEGPILTGRTSDEVHLLISNAETWNSIYSPNCRHVSIFAGPSKVRKSQESEASCQNESSVKRSKIHTMSPSSTRGTRGWNHLLVVATRSRLLGRVVVEAICVCRDEASRLLLVNWVAAPIFWFKSPLMLSGATEGMEIAGDCNSGRHAVETLPTDVKSSCANPCKPNETPVAPSSRSSEASILRVRKHDDRRAQTKRRHESSRHPMIHVSYTGGMCTG